MEPRFVDSNILLRYLTRDDAAKAEAALALLTRVEEGSERVETASVVVFEVVFSLHRRYRVSPSRIRDLLLPVLELPYFILPDKILPDKSLLIRALDIFVQQQIPFGDAVIVATMEARGPRTIYSWDAHFDRIPGLVRVVPEIERLDDQA